MCGTYFRANGCTMASWPMSVCIYDSGLKGYDEAECPSSEMEGFVFQEECFSDWSSVSGAWPLVPSGSQHLNSDGTGHSPVHQPLACVSTRKPISPVSHTQRSHSLQTQRGPSAQCCLSSMENLGLVWGNRPQEQWQGLRTGPIGESFPHPGEQPACTGEIFQVGMTESTDESYLFHQFNARERSLPTGPTGPKPISTIKTLSPQFHALSTFGALLMSTTSFLIWHCSLSQTTLPWQPVTLYVSLLIWCLLTPGPPFILSWRSLSRRPTPSQLVSLGFSNQSSPHSCSWSSTDSFLVLVLTLSEEAEGLWNSVINLQQCSVLPRPSNQLLSPRWFAKGNFLSYRFHSW